MTLGHGQGIEKIDDNLLNFHEKVDDIMEEQESLRLNHLNYLKEVATMITEQGDLIQKLKDEDDNDIDQYVVNMERIVARNLDIYKDMATRLGRFKNLLREEEEAAQ